MKTSLLIISLTILIIVSGCNTQKEISELDSFAKCLEENGLKMYGSMTCSICAKQKTLFGSSFQYVGEIECHPRGENPQTELCLQKDIQKTPTWILEKDGVEIKRLKGYQTLETLSELSGCSMEKI
tara:strand:+ start:22 stop:399 length:378 start_codon:yes stop_codon:yes gene_type:complete